MIVAILLLAAGAGAGYTLLLAPAPKQGGAVAAAVSADGHAAADKSASDASRDVLLPLEPLLVSFEGSAKYWLRLEGSVAFRTPPAKGEQQQLLQQLGEDVLVLLRSTPVAQLENAVGLEFLRDDLSELVRLRSQGRARHLVIKSLVIE